MFIVVKIRGVQYRLYDNMFYYFGTFQNRGATSMHTPNHVVCAPKIDENEDSEVVKLKDNYIICMHFI